MNVWKLQPRPGLERIHAYQPGKPVEEVERELGIAHAIKLASNENPLGPSPQVKAALRSGIGQAHIYPDGASFYLRRALAAFLKADPETIILGNGSNELLVLLARCFLQPGDEVLTSEQSFVVYTLAAQMMGAELIRVPVVDYTFNLDALARAITPRTRIVYIANPNNPTGTAVEPGRLRAFVEQVPAECLVVLDEAYYEYLDKSSRPDTLAWVREHKNLVSLRTFSKAYALAGLRVGYGVASLELAEVVNKVRDPFNVNSLAQIAAVAALKDQAHVRRAVRLAISERKRVAKILNRMGVEAIPSQANFIYVKVKSEGRQVADSLMKLGIIVRPFPGPHIRITLGTAAQDDKMLKALEKILK